MWRIKTPVGGNVQGVVVVETSAAVLKKAKTGLPHGPEIPRPRSQRPEPSGASGSLTPTLTAAALAALQHAGPRGSTEG